MAKKQQPKLSYGPNTGLIAGEAQVAASEAGLANVGQSFVTGAASVFGAIKQANAERDARMEAYESEIGGLVNTNQFEDPKNKQVIKGFLNTQRDEYIKLSKIYDKTKDREVKDKMEEIKFSLVNLNDQIKVFNQDKLDYRTASDENQLASLKTYDRTGDDFFTSAFTNNAAFSIDEMGDINFGINNNSYKYKDKAGKWQSKNNIDESNLLKIYGDSYKEGGKGNAFNSGNVRRGLYNSFKNTGNSALQVFVTTDLTSDESSLSFEEQFASGELSKEMYAGFTAKKDGTYDTDWMFENKNGDVLRNKVSDYFTKVVEDGHGQGRADNYKPALGSGTDGKGGPDQFFLGKQYIPAAAVTPDVNILNEDPKDIPARTAWNQAIFRKVDGQYQVYQDDAFVDVTKEQLRTTLEFSEKVGYDMSGAGGGKTPLKTPEVPADFNKAFRDDEKKVVQYFKNNPSLYPGMKVERTTSDDPEDGNDTFRITMPSGTSKVFTADPLVGDENKIKDTWTWINSNYENNEFAQ